MTDKPRTFRQAVEAWQDRIDAVHGDPGEHTLTSLCNLLDVMDNDIRRNPDDYRRPVLDTCRRQAREANEYVTARLRERAQERGRAMAAARNAGSPGEGQ